MNPAFVIGFLFPSSDIWFILYSHVLLNLTLNEEVFFVNCKKNLDEKELIRYPEFVESLVSEEDKNKFSIRYEANKTMAAKEFHDKVIAREVVLSKRTVDNFKRLFVNLGVIE